MVEPDVYLEQESKPGHQIQGHNNYHCAISKDIQIINFANWFNVGKGNNH